MADGADTRIRRGRKFDQVLAGARDIFLKDGFEGASVDDIARAADVSKATLYSYFPEKTLLFMEVAKGECRKQAQRAIDNLPLDAPIENVLRLAARQMIDFMTSEFGRRMFRISVGECSRFPDVGAQFYKSGPQIVRERLTEILRRSVERGELRVDDVELAADQFNMLCKASIFDRLIFHCSECVSEADKDRVIEGAIEMFMARYAVRG